MLERFNKVSKIIYKTFFIYIAITMIIAIPSYFLKLDNIKSIILINVSKIFILGFLFILFLTCITMVIQYILWISQIKKVGVLGKLGIGIGIIILLGVFIYFDILNLVILIVNIVILGIVIYLAFKIKKYKPETYAIVLYFNEDATIKINQIIDKISNISGNAYMVENAIRPHITIASFYTDDIEKVKTIIRDNIDLFTKSELSFESIKTFAQKVLYLSPYKYEYLIRMNKDIHEILEDNFESADDDNYLPEKWIPHCALGLKMNEKQLEKAFSEAEKIELPMIFSVEKIALAKCNPYREMEIWECK